MRHIITLLFLPILVLSSCAQSKNKDLHMATSSTPTFVLTEQQWKEKLSPAQYYILREKGTERAYSGEFYMNKKQGVYQCAGCGEPLFTSDMKFDSHCGWPSFDKEIEGGKIIQTTDLSHGMKRVEITCAKCGGHLGHIFDDGPTQTGMRYCVNSLSLSFEAKENTESASTIEVVTLGGGCFWCIEAVFEELDGVLKAESGYSGGAIPNPTYKAVCNGTTGHAEVVQVTYDKSKISLKDILEVFFTVHDPTTLNRQGADVGTQYRSAIFYHNEEQKAIAEEIINTLNSNKVFDTKIVTEVTKYNDFYIAENYHQEYYQLNKQQPYCSMVIKPKMDKLYKVFKDKIKNK